MNGMLIGFVSLISLISFAILARWAARNRYRLIVAFASAVTVGIVAYLGLTMAIATSALP